MIRHSSLTTVMSGEPYLPRTRPQLERPTFAILRTEIGAFNPWPTSAEKGRRAQSVVEATARAGKGERVQRGSVGARGTAYVLVDFGCSVMIQSWLSSNQPASSSVLRSNSSGTETYPGITCRTASPGHSYRARSLHTARSASKRYGSVGVEEAEQAAVQRRIRVLGSHDGGA